MDCYSFVGCTEFCVSRNKLLLSISWEVLWQIIKNILESLYYCLFYVIIFAPRVFSYTKKSFFRKNAFPSNFSTCRVNYKRRDSCTELSLCLQKSPWFCIWSYLSACCTYIHICGWNTCLAVLIYYLKQFFFEKIKFSKLGFLYRLCRKNNNALPHYQFFY